MPSPTPSGPDRAALREALLDQLAYLVDEIEALRAVVHRVPEPVLTGRPLPSDHSLKEMYGFIAAADDTVFRPFVEQLSAGETPSLSSLAPEALATGEPWNERSMDAILDCIHEARTRLLDRLRPLSPEAWERAGTRDGKPFDVYTLAHTAVQHDAEWLRTAAHRLHESRLS